MRTTYKKFLYPIFILLLTVSCSKKEKTKPTLFEVINESDSGLRFTNQLIENDSINIIDNEFVYNGAGVALGDLNGDGLDDIFFTGNQVENRLFLNKGAMKFEDVTKKALIKKPDSLMWSSGVNIVDINLDGKNDIYICNTFRKSADQRRNLLFLNKGNSEEGVPSFEERALAVGIADTTYSSHAHFFDHDNDGDLDLFIGVNQIDGINPSQFRPKDDNGNSPTRDRLYQNNWVETGGELSFTDISKKAGIKFHGYSHSSLIHDFNEDGFLDIFVSNDFLSNDLLYINNQDGTYTNKIREAFKHLSLSSMGSDIADVNNDGKSDLYVTEMQPYYNKRKKLFQGPSNYQKEIFTKRYDYEQQYARNVLHLNRGAINPGDTPVFNDIGIMTGLQETDWSWAPLLADIDNDGLQDLFITNGFPRDVTDRDFGDFRVTASRLVSKQQLIDAIPVIKIPNFVFRNKGGLEFEDMTKEWGLDFGTFSNGAAYGDLDNDGDLDFVVNNINDPAILLENKANEIHTENHWIRVKVKGPEHNQQGIGAKISIFYNDEIQQKTVLTARGYLSQPETTQHFGLGKADKVDSIQVLWPGKNIQTVFSASTDTLVTISYQPTDLTINPVHSNGFFNEVGQDLNLNHLVRDIDFIDFNFQSTLPHKFSQYGPSLSVGDVNNDGLEDVFVAASRGFKQFWLLQQSGGNFKKVEVNYKVNTALEEEDSASLLFDADNDGDLDLFLGRGCAQYPEDHPYYQDVLYLNDGNGNFEISSNALPNVNNNTSVVKAADFDRDGDLDLFVGSRVLPFSYPLPDQSQLLENQSENGTVKFVDVTQEVAEVLVTPGLISDALWTDFNNDNWPDLILASEWQPIRLFENNEGLLLEVQQTGLENLKGWWNSLSAADLDNDGDMDYIAGNTGLNVYTKGSKEEPVKLYAKDLDGNGAIDPLISYYLRDSLGVRKEYLYHPWQDVVKQFVGIRKKFNSFGEFGAQTVPEMFSDGLLDDAEVFELNYMHTSWIENLGDGKFEMHELPVEAQLAPVFGIVANDLNGDGFLDITMVGNDFGMEVQQGPADAMNGLVLMNNGSKGFEPLSLEESKFYVPGNAKALVTVKSIDDKLLFVASQNNDYLKGFSPSREELEIINVAPTEIKAIINMNDGSQRLEEFYWGSTFMSQTSRTVQLTPNTKSIEFYDIEGMKTREIQL